MSKSVEWATWPEDVRQEWQGQKRRALSLARSKASTAAMLERLEAEHGHRRALRIARQIHLAEQRARSRKTVEAAALSDVGLYSGRRPRLVRPGVGTVVAVR